MQSKNELIKLIETGEKADVELKKSENGLNKDIYESVCSFNNRNGGHLILGVLDLDVVRRTKKITKNSNLPHGHGE